MNVELLFHINLLMSKQVQHNTKGISLDVQFVWRYLYVS